MYGVKVASNLFPKFFYRILQVIPGTKSLFDDIIIQGTISEQLLGRLKLVFEKLKQKILELNQDKCHLLAKKY